MDKQSRFNSWIAVFTAGMDLLLFILTTYGVLGKLGLTPESWQSIVGLLLVVAANIFAAFNNPTSASKF